MFSLMSSLNVKDIRLFYKVLYIIEIIGVIEMSRVIRAKYENGVLKPLENVDLEEGENVKLVIIRGARGLINVVKRISREYSDVKEDPLKILLEGRR